MTPLTLIVSAARQRFFDLFQAVTSRHGRKVVITKRPSRAAQTDAFRLVGSGRIHAGEDDLVTRIRAEAHRSSERRLAALTKDG
jgi:hypothetical protein